MWPRGKKLLLHIFRLITMIYPDQHERWLSTFMSFGQCRQAPYHLISFSSGSYAHVTRQDTLARFKSRFNQGCAPSTETYRSHFSDMVWRDLAEALCSFSTSISSSSCFSSFWLLSATRKLTTLPVILCDGWQHSRHYITRWDWRFIGLLWTAISLRGGALWGGTWPRDNV